MRYSILVPAYKRRYLAECVASVLSQTYSDWELIVVNDASPENLDSVMSAYSDPRIHYYKNERNCGAVDVVDNWNICLSYSSGEYVICMGDDDRLLPCCLEEYSRMIDAHPGLGLYHAWTEIIDENGGVINMQEPRPVMESVWSMIWMRWNGRLQFIGDFLFDAAALKARGGFYKLPLAWASDDISAVQAAATHGVANSQVPLFQYRSNGLTISRTGNVGIKMEACNAEEDWYRAFVAEAPQSDDAVATVFRSRIATTMGLHFTKKRIYQMVGALRSSFLPSLLFFFRHRKAYRLTSLHLAYACIETLKEKYKK